MNWSVWQISFRRTLWGFVHKFGQDICIYHCWSTTTKKRRVYKDYKMYETYEITEALLVTPNGLHPRWFDLRQRQLLRPSSYGGSRHAMTSDCQRCAANHQQYKCEDDLCGQWPVWSMTCVVKQSPMWSIYTLAEHSTFVKYLPLWYLSADCPLVEI